MFKCNFDCTFNKVIRQSVSFVPNEIVPAVRALRPGGRNTQDVYTWDYSKTGIYTVKSAYWVQTRIQEEDMELGGQRTAQPSLIPLYHQVWKVDAAPKIQHFLWKCLRNCLPVAGNLAYRHLTREACCPRCPSIPESVNHLLFKCSFARLVWAVSPISIPQEGEWSDSQFTNIHRIMNLKMENKDWEEREKLTPWILWRLWKNRNELVFNGREWDAQELVRRAMDDAEEWAKRKQGFQDPGLTVRHERRMVKWNKPPADWLKCNTDGAWPKEGKPVV